MDRIIQGIGLLELATSQVMDHLRKVQGMADLLNQDTNQLMDRRRLDQGMVDRQDQGMWLRIEVMMIQVSIFLFCKNMLLLFMLAKVCKIKGV